MTNKVYRFLDAVVHSCKDKDAKIKYEMLNYGDGVCILLDKGMGDFILFAYYLRKLVKYYQSQGQEVMVIADTYNLEFLKVYAPEVEDITLIFKQDSFETTNGNKLIAYRGRFHTAIAPCWSLTPRICSLLRVLSPKKIYAVGNNTFNRGYCLNDLKMIKEVDTLCMKNQEFYPILHNRLVKKITGLDYGLHVQNPVVGERLIKEKYFVININASNNRKLLAVKKFLSLAERLQKEYGLIPVVLGIGLDESKIKGSCNIEYLNCLDMVKIISLCKYAEFVITSDTGIYHIAFTVKNYILIPTWSCVVPLFEPYPEELAGGRICYIRLHGENGCNRRILCGYRKFRRKCVPCVEIMETDFVFGKIREFVEKKRILE